MSMTREEAYELIRLGIEMAEPTVETYRAYYALANKHNTGKYIDSLRTALSILAPEPRTEPPTVEEVGDGYGEGNEAWVYDHYTQMWILRRGVWIRGCWGVTFNRWLPSSALPKGDV